VLVTLPYITSYLYTYSRVLTIEHRAGNTAIQGICFK
jgi:hypothetical protein